MVDSILMIDATKEVIIMADRVLLKDLNSISLNSVICM